MAGGRASPRPGALEARDVLEVLELTTANQARPPVATGERGARRLARAACCAWRDRAPSARAVADAERTTPIDAIHAASHGTRCARRVSTAPLREAGVRVGRTRVGRLR